MHGDCFLFVSEFNIDSEAVRVLCQRLDKAGIFNEKKLRNRQVAYDIKQLMQI